MASTPRTPGTPGAKPAAARKPRVPRTALTDAQLNTVIFAAYTLGVAVGGLIVMFTLHPLVQLVVMTASASLARWTVARLTRRYRRTR